MSNDLEKYREEVSSLNWSPVDEYVVASGSNDCTVRLWDIRSSGLKACTYIFDMYDTKGTRNRKIGNQPIGGGTSSNQHKEDHLDNNNNNNDNNNSNNNVSDGEEEEYGFNKGKDVDLLPKRRRKESMRAYLLRATRVFEKVEKDVGRRSRQEPVLAFVERARNALLTEGVVGVQQEQTISARPPICDGELDATMLL